RGAAGRLRRRGQRARREDRRGRPPDGAGSHGDAGRDRGGHGDRRRGRGVGQLQHERRYRRRRRQGHGGRRRRRHGQGRERGRLHQGGRGHLTVIAAPSVDDDIEPGDTTATVGGEPATVVADYEDGALALTVGDATLLVGMLAGDGTSLPVAEGGLPRVTEGGSVSVSGSGLRPSSPVDVW